MAQRPTDRLLFIFSRDCLPSPFTMLETFFSVLPLFLSKPFQLSTLSLAIMAKKAAAGAKKTATKAKKAGAGKKKAASKKGGKKAAKKASKKAAK